MTKGFFMSQGSLINVADKDFLYTPRESINVGVVFCHGAGGGYADAQRTQSGFFNLMQRLAYYGCHVISSDWGGPQTWGNDTVLARLETARTVLMAIGCNSKLVMIGGSMGNLSIMRYMAEHPTNVICGVGIIPAIDIEQMRATGANIGATPLIEGAWNLTPSDPIPPRGIPMGRIAEMTSVPWAGWYGGQDTVTESVDVAGIATALGTDSMAVQYDNTLNHGDALVKLCPWDDVVTWITNRIKETV